MRRNDPLPEPIEAAAPAQIVVRAVPKEPA